MITISTTTDEESKSFLETEWQHADMEHYGPEVKWQEENFMFKATDEHHKIRGIIKGKYSMGVVDVNDVIVDHTQRRSGIGKQLIEYVEQFAREKKAHKIWFHTGKGWVAETFYTILGYIKVGELKNHYHGHDFVIFEKLLH
jgi:GNAT superfamily N-acetyltransferase